MELNLWDFSNACIATIITILICYRYNFSNKVLYLLLFHIALIFVIDAAIPYAYMGDQYRYFYAAKDFRTIFTSFDLGNVYYASMLFAFLPFPVFIESIKSLAYINYYIYLCLFLFMLFKFNNVEVKRKFKYFYFLYPTLIYYTSFGTRDDLILTAMFMFLYAMLINFSLIIMGLMILVLIYIKGQNALLLLFTLGFYIILKIPHRTTRWILSFSYVGVIVVWAIQSWSDILYFRMAMFREDTGLSPLYMPDWSYMDIYRVLFAPFFFDARNPMQMIQSCENLGLTIAIYRLYRYLKKIKVDSSKLISMNFFVIISALLYSCVVFNYGTLTRYKFPFIFCWVFIMLLIADKTKQNAK
ncbi:MAG: hypothetical protein K2Y14_04455 [Burkholderiales bacterium]|nr:hypothetical protein [Burkholderiales bacterium]